MKRNTIILLAVLAALGIGAFIWWRRRAAAQAGISGALAVTPSPQAAQAAMQAGGAPFGLTGVAGQIANVVAGLLPPIGLGTTATIPQSTPKLTTVWSNPAAQGLFTNPYR